MKKRRVNTKLMCMIFVLFIFCLWQACGAICGDVNTSGDVNIVDALLIAQYYVDLNPDNFDTAVADVNADDTITIVDALQVARFYVGLLPELSCPAANQDPIWSGGPYTLNGTSDYIDVPDGITSNLNDFSISCHVYLNSVVTWTRIFDFGIDTTLYMMLTPASGDTGYPSFCITLDGNDGEQGLNGTSALSTNSWHHIAVTRSGNTGILYINGQEVDRNTGMTLSPSELGNTTNNYIGRSQWEHDPYLNALIDNFVMYDRALSDSEVADLWSAIPSITPSPTAPPSTNFKVMPLGDSITDGTQIPGGYRIKLWSNIQSAGKTMDFVGSMKNGPTELPDQDHEGHPGWRIDEIDASINNWLDTYGPRIVLLHIGTNDVLQNYNVTGAPDRLSALIDKICAKLPADGKLYVATIIPLSNAGQNQNVINFNNQIPLIVQDKVNQGKPVALVDMYPALTTADLIDGIHPTRNGYDKMADVWFNAIRNEMRYNYE
jgi:lysophospholipase L1-like esterase